MARKRKFGDGGDIREGENENIDSGTRSRAMAWLNRQQESEGKETPAPKAKPAVKAMPKPAAKAEEIPTSTKRLDSDYPDVPKVSTTSSASKEAPSLATRARNAVFPGGTQWPGEGPTSSLGAMGGASSGVMKAGSKVADAAARLGRAGKAGLEAGREAANPAAALARRRADIARMEAEYGKRAQKAATKNARGEDLKEAYTSPSNPQFYDDLGNFMKKGGKVKKVNKYAKGGSVSARADGCAQRGKTKGRMV